MTDPAQLEAVIRGVAIGGFAAAGLALAVTPRPTPTRWLGAIFFTCAMAHVINGWNFVPRPFDPIWAASVVCSGFFWMFALDLLEDKPRASPWRLAAPGLGLACWLAVQVAPKAICPFIWLAYNLLSTGLVAHVLFVAGRGWRGDLVVQRRRLRPILAASAGGYVLVAMVKDMGWLSSLPAPAMGLVQASVLALLALGSTVALLQPQRHLVETSTDTASAAYKPTPTDLSPADRLVLARLDKAMTQDEVWRGEDLSIGALAALVGAPEHRLRKLINGVLGHRNFADYINSRRIAAAQIVLADPEQALKSVSAVAYDLGFASLGPFNRAFRAQTGATPTAWRQQACAGISPRLRLVETGQTASTSNKLA